MTPPSSKPARKPVKRMGRPPKPPADVAANVITTRWTDADKALLEAILASERERLEASGILSGSAERVNVADVLRSLVRQEAERRGLDFAAAS